MSPAIPIASRFFSTRRAFTSSAVHRARSIICTPTDISKTSLRGRNRKHVFLPTEERVVEIVRQETDLHRFRHVPPGPTRHSPDFPLHQRAANADPQPRAERAGGGALPLDAHHG